LTISTLGLLINELTLRHKNAAPNGMGEFFESFSRGELMNHENLVTLPFSRSFNNLCQVPDVLIERNSSLSVYTLANNFLNRLFFRKNLNFSMTAIFTKHLILADFNGSNKFEFSSSSNVTLPLWSQSSETICV
jgi:hypothetical protein